MNDCFILAIPRAVLFLQPLDRITPEQSDASPTSIGGTVIKLARLAIFIGFIISCASVNSQPTRTENSIIKIVPRVDCGYINQHYTFRPSLFPYLRFRDAIHSIKSSLYCFCRAKISILCSKKRRENYNKTSGEGGAMEIEKPKSTIKLKKAKSHKK